MSGAICEKQYISSVNSGGGSEEKSSADGGIRSRIVTVGEYYYGKNHKMLFGSYRSGKVNAMSGITELPIELYITSMCWNLPKMMDEIIECNLDLGHIDMANLNKKMMMIVSKTPYEILSTLNENRGELKRRIEKIMLIESAVSAFGELSPEQANKFE